MLVETRPDRAENDQLGLARPAPDGTVELVVVGGPGGAMTDLSVRIESQLDKVAAQLERDYADRVPAGVVRTMVTEAYTPLRDARVTQFVPVLVDRTVRQRIRTGH